MKFTKLLLLLKLIEGSTTLFKALLDKCLEKEKYILCELIPRVNTPPKLVALYPQVICD